MARQRQQLSKQWGGEQFFVRFRHPLFAQKIVRIVLGADSVRAEARLNWLNLIFMSPANWEHPPETVPPDVVSLWFMSDQKQPVKRADMGSAELQAEVEFWRSEARRLQDVVHEKDRQIAHLLGGKVRQGPSPLLEDAAKIWIGKYKNRDNEHMRNVRCEITRFVNHVGGKTEADAFFGKEKRIADYLAQLCISPGRRNQIRSMLLRFLEDSGVVLDRTKVLAANRKAVRAARGPIRWLEREQAEALAELLPEYWSDVWRVQVGLGLRPTEVITLTRAAFSGDYASVTLQPLKHLTLKTGSRQLQVPGIVREIVKRRFQDGDILFPQVNYRKKRYAGGPWHSENWFCRIYLENLRRAVDALNEAVGHAFTAEDGRLQDEGQMLAVRIAIDARLGRRTSGSLLLRSGQSIEGVAAFLGDDVRTVKEHYAALLSHELDPAAAAV